MAKVFLSCARSDGPAAAILRQRLDQEDVSVFLDVSEIGTGEDWQEAIGDAIEEADVVVVLLSRHTGKSRYVQTEAEHALAKKKFVIPVLLDDQYSQNYIWSLIADRKGIRIDEHLSLEDAAEEIAKTVEDVGRTNGPRSTLGERGFTHSKVAG